MHCGIELRRTCPRAGVLLVYCCTDVGTRGLPLSIYSILYATFSKDYPLMTIVLDRNSMESREPTSKPSRVAKRMGTIMAALLKTQKLVLGSCRSRSLLRATKYFHLAEYPAKFTLEFGRCR